MEKFDALDPQLFMYVGIFLGVIVLFEGIRQMVFSHDAGDRIRSKRFKSLERRLSTDKATTLLLPLPQKTPLSRIPVYGNLPAKMQQAGMAMKPVVFLGISGLIAALIFVVFSLTLGLVPALFLSILSGMTIPMSLINIIRKNRVERFSQQLPDALELMMRGLRVGHPLNTTIENVASNMSDPISTEFGIMADQITYGDSLTEAMFDLANRIDQEDMHYLAVSVSIQHGAGGNLAKMLGTLAKVIRGRFAMRRKIKALSAEGRISAIILSALPLIMYGGTMLTAPDYYTGVRDDPLFMPIASAVIILVVSNYLALRKLVNFRV